MQIAVIENGVVTNVIVGDASTLTLATNPGVELREIEPPAGIGWGYDGTRFEAPVLGQSSE